MCGILGYIEKNDAKAKNYLKKINKLFLASESRGKEASGISFLYDNNIKVIKSQLPASKLIKTEKYQNLFKNLKPKNRLALIGHARLATNGTMENNNNNQPIIKKNLIGVHNGIVVNDNELWEKFPDLNREFEVDTEIFLSLTDYFLHKDKTIISAIRKTYEQIEGTASIAIMFRNCEYILLATNNGSLYGGYARDKNFFAFASEFNILKKILPEANIKQIKADKGALINLQDLNIIYFNLYGEQKENNIKISDKSLFTIADISETQTKTKLKIINNQINKTNKYDPNVNAINSLKRCSKCILPETMPFIKFDGQGVCNYCHSYKKIRLKNQDELLNKIDKNRRTDGKPDILMPFSGGRDSSYGLHYVKNILNLNPIAYSYDWGMLTDLGRRNQARMCGKLGIEHIIISADINKKRENIHKNVIAWLKKPDLGTIPLFMAGDKQYFYYTNKLSQNLNINISIMCENFFERTHFKHGFCGINHSINDKSPYLLSVKNKYKIAKYYTKTFLNNPSFINSTIIDSLDGFISYYMIKHNYLYLFQYIPWNEQEINDTLINEYNWEMASDTKTTWRIGDGTAAFYNFIYYSVAGFTENDTFRSNQIREGVLSRDQALILANQDNQPRYDSIKWYCDTVGLDMEKTLNTIIKIPKLY